MDGYGRNRIRRRNINRPGRGTSRPYVIGICFARFFYPFYFRVESIYIYFSVFSVHFSRVLIFCFHRGVTNFAFSPSFFYWCHMRELLFLLSCFWCLVPVYSLVLVFLGFRVTINGIVGRAVGSCVFCVLFCMRRFFVISRFASALVVQMNRSFWTRPRHYFLEPLSG